VSAALEALVPELRDYARALVDVAGRAGALPRVTSTRRTISQQTRLYARYLAGTAIYPVAFPGTSAHEYGEAFDLVITPMEWLSDLGQVWESWGGTWGGARDPVHFELPGASQKHQHRNIALGADLVLGLVPGISEVELAASLASLGFPRSEILQFLSSPISYVTQAGSP
jgi:hypothetical protein